MRFSEVSAFIAKDVRLELRQRAALNGVLLYLISTLFLCYLAFTAHADARSLSALFWVIILFAATNAVSRSFTQEGPARQSFYNTLASQAALIVSKIIYNVVLMLMLGGLSYLIFSFLLGNFVVHTLAFLVVLAGGCIGFACLLTFVSAIAGRTGNHFALTAVLGFPIALPLVILCVNLTEYCALTTFPTDFWMKVVILFLLDAITATLAYILFPFLWRA
jgi:heme exporter protein B